MSSAFFEFNVATTGLFVAKNNLQITGHNLSNSSTQGYSRQYSKQRVGTPMSGVCGRGMIGTGAEVYGIGQYRDIYLDKKYWSQESTYGEYTTKKGQLDLMETIFGDLSDGGLSQSVSGFFEDLSSLSFSAGDNTYRTSVINYVKSLSKNINTFAENLKNQQTDVNEDIYAVVNKINTIGDQISNLNKQIFESEFDGSSANDLRDKRALLVDELSSYTNVEVKQNDDNTLQNKDKKFIILINGQEFVKNDFVNTLHCKRRSDDEKLDEDDVDDLYDIYTSTNRKLNINGMSGQLKALFDVRDGNAGATEGGSYKGIPYYMDKLNKFVQTFSKAINEGKHMDGTAIEGVIGHIDGYDADGEQGNLLFSYKQDDNTIAKGPNIDYSKMKAINFSLSQEVIDDPSNLATSKSPNTADKSDNEVILGFLKLKNDNGMFKEGNLFDYITGTSNELAVDTKQASKFSKFYKDMSTTANNQRLQYSGVSINEEMTNIVKYQQLYQAASKLVSTIDKIYDITINGLGI